MKVVGVKPGGPADKAGIKLDEFVVSVDDRPISEFAGGTKSADDRERALTEISAAIKGERNTTVRLGVRGLDGMEREVVVTRDAVSQGSVFGVRFLDKDSGIAYLRVSNFHNDTTATVRKKIEALVKERFPGRPPREWVTVSQTKR